MMLERNQNFAELDEVQEFLERMLKNPPPIFVQTHTVRQSDQWCHKNHVVTSKTSYLRMDVMIFNMAAHGSWRRAREMSKFYHFLNHEVLQVYFHSDSNVN